MKKICAFIFLCVIVGVVSVSAQNNVGIGIANPDASSILDLEDAQRGMLIPRMTSIQRAAITSPANGLLVYDVTANCVYYYVTGTGWQSLCQGGGAGVTGPTGAAGNAGQAGAVGATGITGPTGTAIGGGGATGPTGANGAQGVTGTAGLAGVTGAAGLPGNTGIDGLQGPTGIAGTPGATGIAGATGTPGLTGPTGPDWTISALTLNPAGTLTLTTTAPQTVTTNIGAWLTGGNAGTLPPTNFIGTTDNVDWVMKTNTVERARINSLGRFVVNNTTAGTKDVFSAYAGTAVGTITAAAGVTAIAGYTAGAANGVTLDNIAGTAIPGAGVLGVAKTQNYAGVYGLNNVNLINTLDVSYGVFGDVSGSNAANTFAFGTVGIGDQANSTGVLGVSNGQGATIPTGGAGGAFVSDAIGAFADATNVANGTGFVASGNGLANYITPTVGAGIAGIGSSYGVAGFATTSVKTNLNFFVNQLGASGAAGGYFEVDNASTVKTYAYVGVVDNVGANGTLRKIIGPGTVNTIVKDVNNKLVALSCPETPENLFQDYGKGTLANGKTHITMDPIFAKNIIVNDKHDLRVFVQLEGDCKGVYITNKTATGFDVVELAGGNSNVAFTYTVIANRADEVLPDGSVSAYSNERFAPAPGPEQHNNGKVQQVAVKKKP